MINKAINMFKELINYKDKVMEENPIKKWAEIYANKDFININARSGYTITIADHDQKDVYLVTNTPAKELGKHLREALNLSRFVDPDLDKELYLYLRNSERYYEWIALVMKKYGYKTKQKMFKGLLNCSVTFYEGIVKLEPWHQYKSECWNREWLTETDNVVIPETCTDQELGEAIQLALSRCTSRWGNPLYPSTE